VEPEFTKRKPIPSQPTIEDVYNYLTLFIIIFYTVYWEYGKISPGFGKRKTNTKTTSKFNDSDLIAIA
jgi:hypothetical protein